MISLAVLMSLLAAAEAEPPVMSITEARPAERLSASFEARNGRVLSADRFSATCRPDRSFPVRLN